MDPELRDPISAMKADARRKCVVYRAASSLAAKQRAAADSALHRWVILAAHWRPAPDGRGEDLGGALVLQVEEPEL